MNTTAKERVDLVNAREIRRAYLNKRIHELYSAGKKTSEIAKKLGVTETRVLYYLNRN